SAAATAYSESSRPVSSFKNLFNIDHPFESNGSSLPICRQQPAKRAAAGVNESKNYLILPARSVIFVLMLVPRVWKATTQANATSAAATAYSESSRPVSSRKN